MNITDKNLEKLLIVGIHPYFLEKSGVWFTDNLKEILDSRNKQSFYEDNIIFLEKPARNAFGIADAGGDRSINFSNFLRKLDEMGYEKVFKVSDPGEFSQRGGIVDVFPINKKSAVRLDFLGNEVMQ
jgi:hypothetical protein